MPCLERAKNAISALHIDVTNASMLGKYQNSNCKKPLQIKADTIKK